MTTGSPTVPVILNPSSGSGHDGAEVQRIEDAFAAVGLAVALQRPGPGEDVAALARRVMRDEPQVVVGGGGDGTLSAVAGAIVGTQTVLGVLPLGTLNHFAKDLNVPLDLEGATRVIAAGHPVAVDVGEVNGRVFLNNSSLGLYPAIVHDRETQQRLGRGKWAALARASLAVLSRNPYLDVALQREGQPEIRRASFVFIGNNEYVTEGFRLGTRARLDGGTLSLHVAERSGRAGLALLVLRALFGRLSQARALEGFTCQAVTVGTRHRRLRVAADGEVVMMEAPLRYVVHPRALRVFAPKADSASIAAAGAAA